MRHLPSILQIVGLIVVAVVAAWLWLPLGGLVVGAELFAVGVILERPQDAPKSPDREPR